MALRMVTHRIDLGRQVGQSKRTPCFYAGAEIRQTVQPIYDCARYLLDHDLAEESDTIESRPKGLRLPIPTKSPRVSEIMAPPDSGMMSPPVGRVLLAFLV